MVHATADLKYARARRLHLTDAGRDKLKAAVPVWRVTHDRVDDLLTEIDPDTLRQGLRDLA